MLIDFAQLIAQFWFNLFLIGNFDINDAPRTETTFIEDVDKILKM